MSRFKTVPRREFGARFSNHPAQASITAREARAIAEELKAKGLIWFTPPDPVAIAKAIHHKPLVHKIDVASRSPRQDSAGGIAHDARWK